MPTLDPYTKIHTKWIIVINVRVKTKKKKKKIENLLNLGFDHDFLDRTLQTQVDNGFLDITPKAQVTKN